MNLKKQLNDALQDRFACGLRSKSIQKGLLTEDNLMFVMEAADKNSKSLQGSEGIVQKITQLSQKPKDKGGRETCYQCGDPFQGKMFSIVVNAYSKQPEIFEMSNSTVLATIATL